MGVHVDEAGFSQIFCHLDVVLSVPVAVVG